MSNSQVLDKYAESLALGEPLPVHGAVVPVAWPWGCKDSTRALYISVTDRIRQVASEALGRQSGMEKSNPLMHVYDMPALHCTVATLSSFKEDASLFATVSDDEREGILRLYQSVIAKHIKGKIVKGFHIIVDRIEVVPTACIFHMEDPDGNVAALRECIAESLQDPILREYESEHSFSPNSLSSMLHIPNIMHSTFVRFIREPDYETRLSLENIAKLWTPQKIFIAEVLLVHEEVPYMHLIRSELNTFPISLCP